MEMCLELGYGVVDGVGGHTEYLRDGIRPESESEKVVKKGVPLQCSWIPTGLEPEHATAASINTTTFISATPLISITTLPFPFTSMMAFGSSSAMGFLPRIQYAATFSSPSTATFIT